MKKINKTILLISILIAILLLFSSTESHGLTSGSNSTGYDNLPFADSLKDVQQVTLGGCFKNEMTVGFIFTKDLTVCGTCCEHSLKDYLPALPMLLAELTVLSTIFYFLLNYLMKLIKK